MSASSTPSSGDNQPSQATDPLAWRRHLPALASAAAGINEACDAWDAVSDSLCDADGWPLDDKVYGDGKVKRDAEVWKHAEVFLDHGPEVLAGVRAAADGPDYVEGPIVEFSSHTQSGAGGGRGDRLHGDFVARQRAAAPVHGDVREEPVLDFVPLRSAWW